MEDERLAFVAMVADGVGGAESGEEASATALESAMHYLARSTECYYRADGTDAEFINALQAAAMLSHEAVLAKAREVAEGRKGVSHKHRAREVWASGPAAPDR